VFRRLYEDAGGVFTFVLQLRSGSHWGLGSRVPKVEAWDPEAFGGQDPGLSLK
jgi:hypothetical protein